MSDERFRVLVVDDEEDLASALQERLALRGFDALGVTSGSEVLDHLAEGRWDVVLVDVKMPGVGGMELARRIRGDHPEVQVVLMTGHSLARVMEEGKALGVFDYLNKPVAIDQLTRVLRAAASQEGRAE